MAARNATRHGASASSSPAPPRRSLAIAQPASSATPQLQELRRQWKWAAVSQFFYTFAHLIALEDVSIVDVEEDLVTSTMVVLPRLMQRLLVTLTQDRKTTVDNWQTTLRRQYLRRDPAANPIGFEPTIHRYSRAATVETDIKSEERDSVLADDAATTGTDKRGSSVDEHNAENDANAASRNSTDIGPDTRNTTEPPVANEGATQNEDGEIEQNSEESLRDWASLPMLEKLESIHTVIEWHFQSPMRLRSIMRNDDENATWRVEPIGYDAKKNAYWFIGGERLWIQRMPPKPPKKKAAKRKATSNADNRKKKVARVEQDGSEKKAKAKVSSKTSKKAKTPDRSVTEKPATPQRTRRGAKQILVVDDVLSSPPGSSGRARAAKTQANVKLDLQAKQLAAVKAEMEALNRSKSAGKSSATKVPSRRSAVGIRISRRLRGGSLDDDDEWQPIPEEWLATNDEMETRSVKPTVNRSPTRKSTRNKRPPQSEAPRVVATRAREISRSIGLESSDESELTELSDEEEPDHQESVENVDQPPKVNGVATEQKVDDAVQVSNEPQFPPGFVEWETICVSLQEWEEMGHRFEKATHYSEKSLHKILSQDIVPFVTEYLRELEKQHAKEEALMNRKRSSRIAVKEMEKEAARQEAARRAEEDEKMARLRRLEARQKREEDERLKREQAREQRRREREERELARARRLERDSLEPEVEVDIMGTPQPNGTVNTPKVPAHAGTTKPSRHRSKKQVNKQSGENEDWELDCEICGSKGINRDDGVPLMSCGKCNKWQHIPCHDAIDKKAGRPLRDWDKVDFFCKRCLALQSKAKHLTVHAPPVKSRADHPDRQSVRDHVPPALTNGQTRPYNMSSVPASYQQLPGIASFTGFTHYQPHQRGFSPHPSVSHYQLYPPAQTPMDSSILPTPSMPRGSPGAWDTQVQRAPPANHSCERTTPPQPSHTIQTANVSIAPSYPQVQPYGTNLDGSPYFGSTQAVQYPHPYYASTQPRVYSNPASQHPQT